MRDFGLALLAAIALHVVVLLFGGVFFFSEKELAAREPVREVELFQDEEKPAEEEKPKEEKKVVEEIEVQSEKPPEMAEVVEVQQAAAEPAPAGPGRLDALSLGALEAMLSGAGSSGGEFGIGGSLEGGGAIGGEGPVGGRSDAIQEALTAGGALDQTARPTFTVAPNYPSDLRSQKIEGVVFLLVTIDPNGRVTTAAIEKSDNAGFDRSALDAIKRWKFEPAVRDGQKVPSKFRLPIRFSLG